MAEEGLDLALLQVCGPIEGGFCSVSITPGDEQKGQLLLTAGFSFNASGQGMICATAGTVIGSP